MSVGRRTFMSVLLVAALAAAAGAAWAVTLPFEDGFENIAVGEYPSANGWATLSAGWGAHVSDDVPPMTGSRSFLLPGSFLSPQTDYVELAVVPDGLGYEASVYVDPEGARTARVGFIKQLPSGLRWLWNVFVIDAYAGEVWFYGAPGVIVSLGGYAAGTWCTVRAELDYGAATPVADLWRDGQLEAQGVPIMPKEFYSGTMGEVILNQFCLDSDAYAPSGSSWATNAYFDDVRLWELTQAPTEVEVELRPGAYPNTVNLRSLGMFTVAVLSGESFDATTVDPATVEVAGAGIAVRGRWSKWMAHLADANGDGLTDLVVQVETQELDPEQLQEGYACVTGQTYAGEPFQGCDEVTVVPRR